MKMNSRTARTGLWVLLIVLLTGCNLPGLANPAPYSTTTPAPPTPTAEQTTPTILPTETPALPAVWIEPYVPAALLEAVARSGQIDQANTPEDVLRFGLAPEGAPVLSRWVYALVAPFPTITDDVSLDDVLSAWRGDLSGPFAGRPLLVSKATLVVFQALWGEPAAGSVQVMSESAELSAAAWENRPSWAIVPFEDLEPTWKVFSVDGQSPVRKDFDPETYGLSVPFGIATSGESIALSEIPASNRDPEKLTVLVMTGVTALVRATAYAMENHGMTFPAQDIGGWLREADVTHISNEVSFYGDCPDPSPYPGPLYFCSKVEYFDLIKDVGADVVELTGNHNNDSKEIYGIDVVPSTLYLYRQNGMEYYGGGIDLAEARQPALIEHNGNRLAFIGCNPAGPEYAWATESNPGAASCGDLGWMHTAIAQLKAEGYLPIASFQWYENYSNVASPDMERAFRSMADAGAVIVNGSQAHTPKEMELYGDSFIHYGLGNLFFDQMHVDLSFLQIGQQLVPSTRLEFIDRHVIYDGRHISTELLTAMLEDYARPRPMTNQERTAFLQDIFTAAGW